MAHWRSRTALADREWSERHHSLTAERAGTLKNTQKLSTSYVHLIMRCTEGGITQVCEVAVSTSFGTAIIVLAARQLA